MLDQRLQILIFLFNICNYIFLVFAVINLLHCILIQYMISNSDIAIVFWIFWDLLVPFQVCFSTVMIYTATFKVRFAVRYVNAIIGENILVPSKRNLANIS